MATTTSSFRATNKRVVCQALFFELHPIRKILMRTLLGGIASAFLEVWENVQVSSSSEEKEDMASSMLKKSVKLNEEEEEEEEEGGDLSFATFVKAMDISKGFATIFSVHPKKDSKKKKKGSSKAKKEKKKQHNTSPLGGVTRVRQVIDMMLAFPRQYFIDGHKWCSCIVVLLIDFLSHRMRKKLQQAATAANKNSKPLEQELILLDCACRQLLASFVPELSSRYETQSKEKANQWRSVIRIFHPPHCFHWLIKRSTVGNYG